jgi:signal transduction histidine kinase
MDDALSTLRRLIEAHAETIIDVGTAWVRECAEVDLGGRPYAETRGLISDSVGAYLVQLLRDDRGPRDAFIERVTSLRSGQRFHVSTLLRGFFAFRRGLEHVLAQEGVADDLALELLRRVDAVSIDAAFLTADTYAAKLHGVLDATRDELLRKEKLAALGGLVAGIAHEINTPLGVAVTAASFAQDRLVELQTAFEAGTLRQRDMRQGLSQALEAAALALGNLRRAAGLVASFKQIAVDQASEARRPLALGQYVREVVASLAPMYRRTPHHVAVDVRADPTVTTYAGAISQICTNLLHNALTHAFPEGHVGTVTLWTGRAEDGRIELGCRDDGVGVQPDVLRRIFEPFFTTTRGRGGSGLGMHIVHNLVTDLLHGSIDADSTPGRGTTFTVRFPEGADV